MNPIPSQSNPSLDQIFIRELRAPAWIGIYDWEQRQPQQLEFDLDLFVATAQAGGTDDIRDTVDYGKVVERIRAALADRKFNLLEALAEAIAQLLLREFSVQRVRVSVAKIAHMRDVKRVGVAIERSVGTAPACDPPGFADSSAG